MLKNKILLITGGTGSFGNAVLRKFLDSDIKEIRIFSRDESKQDQMRKHYDNPKLNTLIVGSDLNSYFIQYLGRIFRKEGDKIIFDLVDNNNVLRTHWNNRRKVYVEHGGIIKDFKKCFPNIKTPFK